MVEVVTYVKFVEWRMLQRYNVESDSCKVTFRRSLRKGVVESEKTNERPRQRAEMSEVGLHLEYACHSYLIDSRKWKIPPQNEYSTRTLESTRQGCMCVNLSVL